MDFTRVIMKAVNCFSNLTIKMVKLTDCRKAITKAVNYKIDGITKTEKNMGYRKTTEKMAC